MREFMLRREVCSRHVKVVWVVMLGTERIGEQEDEHHQVFIQHRHEHGEHVAKV